jgi:hypothetical protein
MKKISLIDLQSGDQLKINKIANNNKLILATIESVNKGESKNTNLIEIKEGAHLIFKRKEPNHFNDLLFSIPGISENVEISVDENSLFKDCYIEFIR